MILLLVLISTLNTLQLVDKNLLDILLLTLIDGVEPCFRFCDHTVVIGDHVVVNERVIAAAQRHRHHHHPALDEVIAALTELLKKQYSLINFLRILMFIRQEHLEADLIMYCQ